MIKEEFIKHGWEIRNDFKFKRERHYDAVKCGIKLCVDEYGTFTCIEFDAKKGIQLDNALLDWWRLSLLVADELQRLSDAEDARMARALLSSQRRKERYQKIKGMFQDGKESK